MNKKQVLLIGITLLLLFTGIALATSSASSDVIIRFSTKTRQGAIKVMNGLSFTIPQTKAEI